MVCQANFSLQYDPIHPTKFQNRARGGFCAISIFSIFHLFLPLFGVIFTQPGCFPRQLLIFRPKNASHMNKTWLYDILGPLKYPQKHQKALWGPWKYLEGPGCPKGPDLVLRKPHGTPGACFGPKMPFWGPGSPQLAPGGHIWSGSTMCVRHLNRVRHLKSL